MKAVTAALGWVVLAGCGPTEPALPARLPVVAALPRPAPPVTPVTRPNDVGPAPTAGLPPPSAPAGPPPPIVDCAPEVEDDAEAGDGAELELQMECCTEERYAELERMVVDRNLDARQCDAFGRLRRYAACPTFFVRGFLALLEGCFSDVTERAQERHLSRLARTPAAAAREQALRRRFDAAQETTLRRIGETEPATGDFRSSIHAHIALLQLRRRHIEASEGRRLSIGHPPAEERVQAAFGPYAQALCADASRWSGGAVPEQCEARVRGAIDDALRRAHQY